MQIETIAAIVTAIGVSITAIVAILRMHSPRPDIRCSIMDPLSTTYQNDGKQNVLLIEKQLRIENRGEKATYLIVDILTSRRMSMHPKIDTPLESKMRPIDERNGYYGRYLNLSVKTIPPNGSVIVHLWCKAIHLDENQGFFEHVCILSELGEHACVDRTDPSYYDDKDRTRP